MKKLTFEDLNTQQIVDIRSQVAYQKGHLLGSLNLNPGNFKGYATDLLSIDQPIVFVVGEETEEERAGLEEVAKELGFRKIDGFLLAEDISADKLHSTKTISAQDFLNEEGEFILLDVRHPDEITRPAPEIHLVNIPLAELADELHTLDKSQTIYTLCGSGNRGTTAASYLTSNGYNPIVIAGGMKAIEELRK